MDILITGGAGFIGSRLKKRLEEENNNVVVLDSFVEAVHGSSPTIDDQNIILGDVANANDWDKVFNKITPEIIFHLAAETGTGTSLTNPTIHTQTNVHGTAQMIEQLQKRNIMPKRIVLSSSRAVYGEGAYVIDGNVQYVSGRHVSDLDAGNFDILNSDKTPASFIGHNATELFAQPSNVYATTKFAQENLLKNYASAYDISLHIQRFQNVYGQGQALGNPYTGILVVFINAALKGEPVYIYENGGIVRDFVHVDDIVSSLISSMKSQEANFLGDIGSGAPVNLEDVAKLIIETTGSSSGMIMCDKYRLGDVRKAYANIDHANKILGYSPNISLADGLKQFANWATAQNTSV